MKIDLLLDFATPPGDERSLAEMVEDGLALARAADCLGFDAIWVAEHHFLDHYSHASCPDMLLAALARETSRIGLGFGIVPLPIHEPVRVAERLSTLDLLSDGRVLWGAGRGLAPVELQGFGVRPEDSRKLLAERLGEVRSILRRGGFVREGQFFDLRPAPRPDLADEAWLAAGAPESFDMAAAWKLNVLAGPFKPWPMVRADLNRYRKLWPGGRGAFTLAVHCDLDQRRARRRAGRGVLWLFRQIFALSRPLLLSEVEDYDHYRAVAWVGPLLERMLTLPALEALGLAAVGTPEHVGERLEGLQASGLDRVCIMPGGGGLEREEMIRSLELIADKVMPRLTVAPSA
ncbi:LLM class flavin-dependent oxidoreductase [Telmatospirillum sp. J64-1]|uniref:LLM class flavin-dependent oxidoreductase n=1 Tax=Telmatospirillum sp. J64-1 TaxID=2502183 RepID=UPI00163D8118|nr:LLM class flavin-dependent oxidoreductase [Telmatospirillum sp. J64-1]